MSYLREQGARTAEDRWSPASRIIRFDGPRLAWLLTESVHVCAPIDKIRPATPAEAAAYTVLHKDGSWVDYVPGPDEVQQKFVNERRRRRRSARDEVLEEASQPELPSALQCL